MDHLESSIVGAGIQFSGTVLVTILCGILLRSVRRPFLSYWAAGWASLTLALAALLVGFALDSVDPRVRSWQWVFYSLYCFGEYVAGYLWIAGCRNLTADIRLTRRDAIWLAPAAMVAVVVPWMARSQFGRFDGLMVVHSLFMACLFATAFAVLYASRQAIRGAGAGVGVMMAALFVLTVAFLQHGPLYGYSQLTGQPEAFPHLKYFSLYDLMLKMLLAFGMVMVVMDHVLQELGDANRELRSTGSRLMEQAQRDPLTGALNRHAFDALLRQAREDCGPFAGCVAILDLDNLKPINDTLGHDVGDRALRLVAQSVRSIIRPDDLLFRWGGDEFLIFWLGNLKPSDAADRLDGLNRDLQSQSLQSSDDVTMAVSFSYGLARFADAAGLESAIRRADASMYSHKAERRAERRVEPSFP